MASADKYDIIIEQGATFSLALQWLAPSQIAIDITGYTAKMQIRDRYGSPVIIELSTDNGRINITNPTNGQFTLDITSSDTNNLPAGCCGIYDLELTISSTVTRLLEGKVKISPQVTV